MKAHFQVQKAFAKAHFNFKIITRSASFSKNSFPISKTRAEAHFNFSKAHMKAHFQSKYLNIYFKYLNIPTAWLRTQNFRELKYMRILNIKYFDNSCESSFSRSKSSNEN